MADDPLSRFTGKFGGKQPTASTRPPSAAARPTPDTDDAQGYEAFDNKVRPVCLEIRCHRSGWSYSLPYAHMGAVVFNFRTGKELSFTGSGLGVTIEGWNLGHIALALRLHSCSLLADHDPQDGMRPLPGDPAAFIERIRVEVLHGPSAAKAQEQGDLSHEGGLRKPLPKGNEER
jgi:hypothetical protein